MAVLTERVRRATGLPVGINVLANAALHALAVAKAAGAGFIRVNQWANAYVANEGLIEGPAAEAMRYRRALGGAGRPHFRRQPRQARRAMRSPPTAVLAELTRDLEWFGADAVIATGQRTGDRRGGRGAGARSRPRPACRVLVGSGATAANVAEILARRRRGHRRELPQGGRGLVESRRPGAGHGRSWRRRPRRAMRLLVLGNAAVDRSFSVPRLPDAGRDRAGRRQAPRHRRQGPEPGRDGRACRRRRPPRRRDRRRCRRRADPRASSPPRASPPTVCCRRRRRRDESIVLVTPERRERRSSARRPRPQPLPASAAIGRDRRAAAQAISCCCRAISAGRSRRGRCGGPRPAACARMINPAPVAVRLCGPPASSPTSSCSTRSRRPRSGRSCAGVLSS